MLQPRWLVASLVAALGCGSGGPMRDAADAVVDSPIDATDAAHDPGPAADGGATGDSATEVAPDAPGDVAPDSPADVAPDSPGDAAPDGPYDGAPDGARDATTDASSRPCEPNSRWFDLAYPVTAAAYTRVLDLLVVLPATERSLHIIDPESCSDRTVALPRRGLSVAIAPSGRTVAVGHDGEVSIVDLVLASRVASYRVSRPASEVAYDAKGRVHIYTRAVDNVDVPLLILDPATGASTNGANRVNAGGHLRATPDGTRLYWVYDASSTANTFAEIDPGTGAVGPLQNVTRSIAVCYEMFPTDDSAHLITACGTVLDLPSAGSGQPPVPRGVLEGVSRLDHVDSLISRGVVVSLGGRDLLGDPPDAAEFLRVHDGSTFGYVKRIDLPLLSIDGQSQSQVPYGRSVFVRSDGSRYYVLARRSGFSWFGMANGVARLDAGAVGQTVTTPIPVPAPSRYALLPPLAAAPITTAPLAFDVVDAGYSRSLDRLVVVSASPTPAVLLVNPATGAAETLATPANPSKVFVRADGAVAGVLRSGGVTFLDLPAGTSLREHTATATRVAFGANGQALLGTDGLSGLQTLSWLDVAAGTTRVAFFAPAGGPGTFGTVPGTQSFYTTAQNPSEQPLARHDDVGATGDLAVELAMFKSDSNTVPDCGRRFWISDDGARLILDCGRVYRLSRTPAQDLVYVGGLDTIPVVTDAAYAGTSDRLFVLPAQLFDTGGTQSEPSVVTVHDADTAIMRARIDLPSAPGLPVRLRPSRVFVGPTPDRLYVLAAPDVAGLRPVVLTVDVSGL